MIFRVLFFTSLLLFNSFSGFTPSRASEIKSFTDSTGETIILHSKPLRVVSLAPSVTEIIFALGKGSLLSGVTRYSDFPVEAKSIPSVGSYIRPEIETIVGLKPDLCIAIEDGNPKKTIQRIRSFGIPVFTVQPDGIDSILRSILEIGDLLGAKKEAKIITEDMKSRLKIIDNAISQNSKKPGVFLQIGISPIVSVGKNTFIDELIRRAGGENVVTSYTPYPRFSMEQVLGLAPQMIIITSMARDQTFDRMRQKWESWPTLPAVRNKAIYIVDSDILDRPTPRVIDGLSMLAELIHPELFSKGVSNE